MSRKGTPARLQDDSFDDSTDVFERSGSFGAFEDKGGSIFSHSL